MSHLLNSNRPSGRPLVDTFLGMPVVILLCLLRVVSILLFKCQGTRLDTGSFNLINEIKVRSRYPFAG